MTILQSLLLSIVEGFTEFLPISSTGHLILASNLLKIAQTDFVKSFEIIIQLGAILAVASLYWKKIFINNTLWKKILVAFIPSSIVGYLFYSFIKDVLIGNPFIVLASLFLGGVVLIILEKFYKENINESGIEKVNYQKAFAIGLFQSISVVPGVSRAAATISGGLLTGLSRKTAVEFSFLLAIPTMLGATTLDLIKNGLSFNNQEIGVILIGFIGSFITAIISIKFLLSFVKSHSFIPFAIYRILLAIVYFAFLI